MNAGPDIEAVTRATVEAHNRCWAAGDLPGLFALYHPAMAFTDHYTGKRYTGQALRDHVAGVIRRSTPGSLVYHDGVRVDGDTAFLRYSETIRSAAGNDVLTVTACDVVRVADGLILEIQEFALPAGQGSKNDATDANDTRTGSAKADQKIGLSARALGYLLDDLATYLARDQPYLKPSLSLNDVATATGYSRNQISFALNQGLGTTFYDFINRARIEHVLQANRALPAGGVQGLAESAGFRSISTFYAAFKAVTGRRPREYFT